MRDLSASDLLEIWERGAGATPLEQALVMLAAAFPDASREALAGLTVTQRDMALFHLREKTFGTQFKGLADCPACGERLELDFAASELRSKDLLPAEETLPPDPSKGGPSEAILSFNTAGYRVAYRLPTSTDLMKVNLLAEAEQARRALLEACIVSVRQKGQAVPLQELPAKAVQAIVERIGQAAALADLIISATCPACGHKWEIIFDVVSYFWSEINAWAARMLHEVHVLAATYGWREADILAMSAWRRQRYLELIGA
jgi:hypothetical protein